MSHNTCYECKFYGEKRDFSWCAANPPVVVEALAVSWLHENKVKAGKYYDPDDVLTFASRQPSVGPDDLACRLFDAKVDVSGMFREVTP